MWLTFLGPFGPLKGFPEVQFEQNRVLSRARTEGQGPSQTDNLSHGPTKTRGKPLSSEPTTRVRPRVEWEKKISFFYQRWLSLKRFRLIEDPNFPRKRGIFSAPFGYRRNTVESLNVRGNRKSTMISVSRNCLEKCKIKKVYISRSFSFLNLKIFSPLRRKIVRVVFQCF